MHLTTVDMSLELLLAPILDEAVLRGHEVIGVSAPGPFVERVEDEPGAQELPGALPVQLGSPSAGSFSTMPPLPTLRTVAVAPPGQRTSSVSKRLAEPSPKIASAGSCDSKLLPARISRIWCEDPALAVIRVPIASEFAPWPRNLTVRLDPPASLRRSFGAP